MIGELWQFLEKEISPKFVKEARREAQDRPLPAQVEGCQEFIQRSQRRLERLQEAAVGHRSGAHGKILRGDG